MSDIVNRINDYFFNVSEDQLKLDMIEAGFELRCKNHPMFDPHLNDGSECSICQNLINDYRNSKRFGNG